MVVAMGGQEGKYFAQFCKLAIEAYKQLRRNAVLIMSLLRLMKDAGIEALQVDPESRLRFVEERFRLDLDDESAEEVGQGAGVGAEERGGGGAGHEGGLTRGHGHHPHAGVPQADLRLIVARGDSGARRVPQYRKGLPVMPFRGASLDQRRAHARQSLSSAGLGPAKRAHPLAAFSGTLPFPFRSLLHGAGVASRGACLRILSSDTIYEW